MVKARSLLVAIALTATVPSVVQARVSTFCKAVRQFAAGYTMEQLEQMADAYNLSDHDKQRAKRCLRVHR